MDLTKGRRLHLTDFLGTHVERGEEVVALKEVSVGGHARVAREEDGTTSLFVVYVIEVGQERVVARGLREGRIAFSPDYPCIVRA
ncbi:MAG: hypothetical protein ABII19_00040 [Patescibacteria group bacterium]